MKGEPLVQEIVHQWEDIVNKVAKSGLDKKIVCSKSASGHKKVVSFRKEL